MFCRTHLQFLVLLEPLLDCVPSEVLFFVQFLAQFLVVDFVDLVVFITVFPISLKILFGFSLLLTLFCTQIAAIIL